MASLQEFLGQLKVGLAGKYFRYLYVVLNTTIPVSQAIVREINDSLLQSVALDPLGICDSFSSLIQLESLVRVFSLSS